MAEPTKLTTRIISKHITLEQANTGTWKPYEGEIVLARVDTQKPDGHGGLVTVPTYLMKVGAKWPADSTEGTPGELMPINKLQWTHALASDVYGWAKQSKLAITTQGSGNVISAIEATDAGITITKTEVATTESISTINGAIEALQTALSKEVTDRTEADTTLDNKITAINNNLTGTTDGTIGKRLKDVEDVASGAASKADQNATNLTNYKAEMVETLEGKVNVSDYDAKMLALDTAINTTIPDAIDGAKSDVITTIKGTGADTHASETIAGAKKYADKVAEAQATAAETAAKADAASNLAAAKTELSNQTSAVDDKVTALTSANNTAHEGFNNKISALEEKVANVSNVMDFVGVASSVSVDKDTGVISITVEGVTAFQKGDVVVSTDGKEYVYDGAAWHEFGSTTATDAAIVEVAEDLADFEATVAKDYATKLELAAETSARGTAINNLDAAYKAADAALKIELEGEISDAQTAAYNEAIKTAGELDAAQTTAITAAYQKAIADAKTAIENAQNALDAAQNTKITALEDEVNGKGDVKGLRTLITEEASRADAAEKKNAAAIEAITKDYLKAADKTELANATAAVASNLSTLNGTVTANKQDVDTNFVKVVNGKATVGGNVIIFDCGGVEEA